MFLSAFETTVFYFPFLAVFALAIMLWNEIDTYLDISKLKFPKEMKAFGHAYTFTVRFASVLCFLSIATLAFAFAWNLAESFDSSPVIVTLLVFLPVVMVGLTIGALINEIALEHLRCTSETAQLLLKADEQLTKTAALLSDNEKRAIVERKKKAFWEDMRTNFWKLRIAKKF
jgi:uncharacterized membrane protein (UPF0182 family)